MAKIAKFVWETKDAFRKGVTTIFASFLLFCSASYVLVEESAAGQLQGTLFGENSSGLRYPIPYASLQFCAQPGLCENTITSADGSYGIEVPPGQNYNIIAPSRDGGSISEDIYIPNGMKYLDILAD